MKALILRIVSTRNVHILVAALIVYAHIAYSYGYNDFADKETRVGARYVQMIDGQDVPKPYAYRIAIPFLCFGSQDVGWFWMGLGFMLAGIGLYRLTLEVTESARAAWFAMLLFLLWYEVKGEFLWYTLPDGMATAALAWSIYAAVKRQIGPAFIIAALGILCREVVLFAIPPMLIFASKRRFRRAVIYSGLLMALYFVIISLAHPVANGISHDTLNAWQLFWETAKSFSGKFGSWEWTWSCIALLLPVFVAGLISFPDKRVLVGALPVLLIFFVLDTPRMYIFAAAGIFPVAGWGLHKLIDGHESIIAAAIATCYLLLLASNVRDMAPVTFFVIAVALASRKGNNPKGIKEDS